MITLFLEATNQTSYIIEKPILCPLLTFLASVNLSVAIARVTKTPQLEAALDWLFFYVLLHRKTAFDFTIRSSMVYVHMVDIKVHR